MKLVRAMANSFEYVIFIDFSSSGELVECTAIRFEFPFGTLERRDSQY